MDPGIPRREHPQKVGVPTNYLAKFFSRSGIGSANEIQPTCTHGTLFDILLLIYFYSYYQLKK